MASMSTGSALHVSWVFNQQPIRDRLTNNHNAGRCPLRQLLPHHPPPGCGLLLALGGAVDRLGREAEPRCERAFSDPAHVHVIQDMGASRRGPRGMGNRRVSQG
jgi:hypothetical protein